MKLNRQHFTVHDLASLSPKSPPQQGQKTDQSQQDIQKSILRTLTKKRSFQSNFQSKIRKASFIPKESIISSFSSQNDLLKLIYIQNGNKVPKKGHNITQQFFNNTNKIMKTEASQNLSKQEDLKRQQSYSPVGKGYIDPQWLSKIQQQNLMLSQGRQTPGSLASTELDPMSLYKNQQLEKIHIILHLGEEKHQYFIDPMYIFIIRKKDYNLARTIFNKRDQNGIAPFVTDLNIDYFLQCKDRSLGAFRSKTLNLKPYCPNNPIRKGNVCLKDYLFIKCLGVGGFSRVYLVKRLQTGRFYAMKLIDKEFILKNKTEAIVQNERDILAVVDNPFLVKLEYSFEHRNFLVFVLEFCSGGELFQQLKRVKRMTEEQAMYYFAEVCLGIFYLHQLNICYRDVKPENILLDADGHVRIADFGLSKPNMSERDIAYSFCGSPEYMAPEMLKKEGHTLAVDTYCLGVLLYELVTGLPPFYSRDITKIYQSILADPVTFPNTVELSKEIKDLLTRLLAKNPQNRIGSKDGLAEVLAHPWFNDISITALLEKRIPPPFIPDAFKFNFHIHDNTNGTGEIETIDKLLGRNGLTQDIRVFEQFYFDRHQENQIKIEQASFYKHYKLLVSSVEQKVLQQKRKESKQFSLDTFKCSVLGGKVTPQLPKSPASLLIMNTTTKRSISKNFVLHSPQTVILKKQDSNLFHTDRFKTTNNTQQMDQFLHGQRISSQLYSSFSKYQQNLTSKPKTSETKFFSEETIQKQK